MSTRLFFAIFPDPATQKALCAAQDNIICKANRVAPENLHMTLAFLGNCEEDQIPCISNAPLKFKASPFQIPLKRYRMITRQHILACSPLNDPPALVTLQKNLLHSLNQCDIRFSNRFMPHVSLFRNVKSLPKVDKLEPPIVWQVQSFMLIASVLKPDKAHYQILKTYDL